MSKPAFPRAYSEGKIVIKGAVKFSEAQTGMTMRQYYKGQIVKGLLSMRLDYKDFDNEKLAFCSGEMADALLKEDEEHERRQK